MSDEKQLAAEIRKHIAPEEKDDPDGHWWWWYPNDRHRELPEALAANLIKAGWRSPAETERLRDALAEALHGLQEMIGYMPDDLRDKRDMDSYINHAIASLMVTPGGLDAIRRAGYEPPTVRQVAALDELTDLTHEMGLYDDPQPAVDIMQADEPEFVHEHRWGQAVGGIRTCGLCGEMTGEL